MVTMEAITNQKTKLSDSLKKDTLLIGYPLNGLGQKQMIIYWEQQHQFL